MFPGMRGVRLDQIITEQRGHDDGSKPGYDKRQADDGEQTAGEFGGVSLGESDRYEAGASDQGAGQHRDRRCRIGVAGGIITTPTLLQLDRHHFNRDNRIIDQQAKRNDQGAQGNFVQIDTEDFHASKHRRQYQRNAKRHYHTGAQSQTDETDDQHDYDGFQQRFYEFAN